MIINFWQISLVMTGIRTRLILSIKKRTWVQINPLNSVFLSALSSTSIFESRGVKETQFEKAV